MVIYIIFSFLSHLNVIFHIHKTCSPTVKVEFTLLTEVAINIAGNRYLNLEN